MYVRSASLYDVMHPTQDYEAAAGALRKVIADHDPTAHTVLDVACGTGRHVELLAREFDVEGLDVNPDMLSMARQRCPEITFHEADMRAFALGRRFDVVTCLFSSVGYVDSYDALVATLRNLRDHTNPGGLVVVEPWLSVARYRVGEVTMHTAGDANQRISWMYTSVLDGRRSVFDIHHLVGTSGGVEHFVERHSLALFDDAEYARAFHEAGLTGRHDPQGFFGYGLWTAVVDDAGETPAGRR